jgi:hypothetical protein
MFCASAASDSFSGATRPPHVHAESGDGYAKMWLGSPVVVAESRGFSPRELRAVLAIVTQRRAMMEKAWHDHFEA